MKGKFRNEQGDWEMYLRPTKEEREPARQVPPQFRREMRQMMPVGEYVINLEVGKKS